MASTVAGLSHLANPLATPEQLVQSSSQAGRVPREIEDSVRYHACTIIQAAGILLRLPQQTIAETIVLFTRFWLGPSGGSILEFNAQDVAAACLYLVTKPGPYPLSPRQVLTVFHYVIWHTSKKPGGGQVPLYTEGGYQKDRVALVKTEAQVLRRLGFQTHVALPHPLCINYLQTLQLLGPNEGHELAQRAHAHLNSALFSPQLVYLTHQPSALAVAAIYLAAREQGVTLPDEPWWEVFDVDREELGFLVIALTSMTTFVESHNELYGETLVPLTAAATQVQLGLDE